jgi:hypothetical protein
VKTDTLWMQTYCGIAFRFPPTEDMFALIDIAHALSMQCRYNGHCHRFYSVAEHSVLLARWFAARGEMDLARAALFHDAGEAYVSDVPRPIKPYVPEFSVMSDAVDEVIAAKWRIAHMHSREIKAADLRILADEQAVLMPNPPRSWHFHPDGPLNVRIECWSPHVAENEFIRTYQLLFADAIEEAF